MLVDLDCSSGSERISNTQSLLASIVLWLVEGEIYIFFCFRKTSRPWRGPDAPPFEDPLSRQQVHKSSSPPRLGRDIGNE